MGGKGKPFPEGEEGGWKRKLPKPPTPRGLVGLWIDLIKSFLRRIFMIVVSVNFPQDFSG